MIFSEEVILKRLKNHWTIFVYEDSGRVVIRRWKLGGDEMEDVDASVYERMIRKGLVKRVD